MFPSIVPWSDPPIGPGPGTTGAILGTFQCVQTSRKFYSHLLYLLLQLLLKLSMSLSLGLVY